MSAQERGLTVMQPQAIQMGVWAPPALTAEDWATRERMLRDLVMKGASAVEVDVAIATCKALGFDPLLKHINLIDGAVYVTHKGLLHAAHRSGQFDGIELVEVGETTTHWTARVAVYRKDMAHPFVYPGRYAKQARNAKYGQEMAITRAECMALRRAFDLSLPVAEEFDQEDRAIPASFEVRVEEARDGGQSQIGAGGEVPDGELGWAEFWDWARKNGYKGRADLDAALGRPTSGMLPGDIARALLERRAASQVPAVPAEQKTREYSAIEKAAILIDWLAKRARTQDQQVDAVSKLLSLSDDQGTLEGWRERVTPHVHQDVLDLQWFNRMEALDRLHLINGQVVEAEATEPVSGEPGPDVPF